MTTRGGEDSPCTDSENQGTDRQTEQDRNSEAQTLGGRPEKLAVANHHTRNEGEAMRGGEQEGSTRSKPEPKP